MATLESTSDVQLQQDIIDAIQEESEVKRADINVAVHEGVATLTGFVHSYFAKLAAEEAAKRVRGIEGLANDIQVKLGSEASDPEIARDAVQVLREQPAVPHGRITVTVR